MIFSLFRDFIICIPATAFLTILLKVPKKAAIIGTILGSFGYILYEYLSPILNSPIAAYFIATLFMSVCCEICARIIKMPTTVIIIPCILPLVPGIGLYNTMYYLVVHENQMAAQTGITTIFAIIAMAMALVLTNIFTMAISGTAHSLRRRK